MRRNGRTVALFSVTAALLLAVGMVHSQPPPPDICTLPADCKPVQCIWLRPPPNPNQYTTPPEPQCICVSSATNTVNLCGWDEFTSPTATCRTPFNPPITSTCQGGKWCRRWNDQWGWWEYWPVLEDCTETFNQCSGPC